MSFSHFVGQNLNAKNTKKLINKINRKICNNEIGETQSFSVFKGFKNQLFGKMQIFIKSYYTSEGIHFDVLKMLFYNYSIFSTE